MTEINVVGGVYKEICYYPEWDQYYGSGGRAAIAVSKQFKKTHLHTCLTQEELEQTSPLFESFSVEVSNFERPNGIKFTYHNCLSTPQIQPDPSHIKQVDTFEIECTNVIMFGMMEASPKVKSEVCVYDPQSPSNPVLFSQTQSSTDSLAIVTNRTEAMLMTGSKSDNIADIATELLTNEKAEVVIIKNGVYGAFVKTREKEITVPAFKTSYVFTIGSGDVFVAAFATGWIGLGLNPFEAAEYASKATADYVETQSLPIPSWESLKDNERMPVSLKGGKVYLAGPFREMGQRFVINEAKQHISSFGMKVFSPVHDIGHGPASKVVFYDLKALDECDAVFALLGAKSPGTAFEVGYAIAKNKPVFGVITGMSENDYKLPQGSGCNLYKDYVSAIFNMAWRE